MELVELKAKLNEIGIEEYEYNLGDKPIRELELGITNEGGTWSVYQTLERGGINIIETFENESDACELILKYLIMRKRRKERKNSIFSYRN